MDAEPSATSNPEPLTPAQLADKAQSERRIGLMILENRSGAELHAGVPHFRAAADLWSRAGWPTRRGEVLLDLARLHAKAQEPLDAAQCAEEALRLFQGASDPQAGMAAIAAGSYRLDSGDAAAAVEHYRAGVRLCDQAVEHLHAAEARLGLGRSLTGCAKGADALPHLESALTTFSAFKQALLVAATLGARADARLLTGDAAGAAADIDASVAKYLELARPIDAHDRLAAHAELVLRMGDAARARALWERALGWHRESGNRNMQGRCLRRLGSLAGQARDYEAACACFRDAIAVSRAIDDRPGLSRSLLLLGTAEGKAGRAEAALAAFEESLREATADGNLVHQEEALGAMAHHHRRHQQLDATLDALRRRVEVLRQLGERQEQLEVLGAMAEVLQETGATAEAEAHLRRLIDVCQQPGDRRYARQAQHQLGFILAQTGRHGEADGVLQAALADLPETDRTEHVQIRYRLAMCRLNLQDPRVALEHLAAATAVLAAAGETADPDGRWRTRLLVAEGNAKTLLADAAGAKAAFAAAAALAEQRGDLKQTISIRKATQSLA